MVTSTSPLPCEICCFPRDHSFPHALVSLPFHLFLHHFCWIYILPQLLFVQHTLIQLCHRGFFKLKYIYLKRKISHQLKVSYLDHKQIFLVTSEMSFYSWLVWIWIQMCAIDCIWLSDFKFLNLKQSPLTFSFSILRFNFLNLEALIFNLFLILINTWHKINHLKHFQVYSSVKWSHIIVQWILRTFSSWKTQILYPLNNNSPSPPPSMIIDGNHHSSSLSLFFLKLCVIMQVVLAETRSIVLWNVPPSKCVRLLPVVSLTCPSLCIVYNWKLTLNSGEFNLIHLQLLWQEYLVGGFVHFISCPIKLFALPKV